MSASSTNIRRITVSAVLLSLALVTKSLFTFYVPIFGENGMQIGISGVFSILPSILFGPVYGAIVSGLSDLLGYLLKPTGAYMPLMTLIMAAGGFLRGAIWYALRGKSDRNMRILVAAVSTAFLAAGLFLADGQALIWSAGLGYALTFADYYLSNGREDTKSMQILIAMLVSGLIVTTLNTVVLRETVLESWKALPFFVVWLPRVIEEVLGNIVKAYFVAFLFGLCGKNFPHIGMKI